MAQQLNPYITFDGCCAEAMDFYATALGGKVQGMSFRDAGMDVDRMMHVALETPAGFHLYASDHGEGMFDLIQGNNVQVSLSGDDQAALQGYWDALSDGATVTIPLAKQMWGDHYGQLVDKFGIIWHCNINGAGQAS